MSIRKKRCHRKTRKMTVFGLVLVVLFFSVTAWAEILIITNKNVSENTLNQEHLQDIFLGKVVQWEDHKAIRMAVLRDPKLHEVFLEEYIHKSQNQWRMYWKRMVFTGRGLPPRTVNSEAEMLEYVAETDGAIGYVTSDKLGKGARNIPVNILEIAR